jgi:hypothetical protein
LNKPTLAAPQQNVTVGSKQTYKRKDHQINGDLLPLHSNSAG